MRKMYFVRFFVDFKQGCKQDRVDLQYNISGRLFADEHFNGAVEAATTLTGAILGMLFLYIAVLKGSTLLYNLHTIDR